MKKLYRNRTFRRPLRASEAKTDYERSALGEVGATTKCGLPGGARRVRVCVTEGKKITPKKITGPESVCSILRDAKYSDRESFYVLYIDARGNVNGIEEAHKGTLMGVEVHPREVFKGALLTNAHAVIVAHNHPSGNPQHSSEDIALTDRLVKAGKLLGIPVLDHVIVARGGCSSINEEKPHLFRGPEEK